MEDPKHNVSGAKHETSFRTNQGALQNAEISASNEKNMSLRENMRVYKKAIAWSMVLSTALIMEGYDVVIVRRIRQNILHSDLTADQFILGSNSFPEQVW